ncbi:FtsQ-type POTRA domain-containing protein [Acidithiobacillus sp. CV18-2]|uniref:Cell division protein FtsQ n=1 Tax=Igneacidithiobacillus copahuensis TaxID=2724909 RepID=A0AAE3CJF8_9PROT|nr:cell division protein FtsQ/DivIB [Igneacidithiobacillus copahuensis]MBU2755510.1 FtsQ-type POTRA domain-containing protein [Acidithiobacillus sp. CV18-3]MBU2757819.1 FtsQ-type POTRA domain-containing protein [Acidithiobacillus sp. BN09-2]MBU2777916.1 FtsQ-type POTRA domain-containing protein [Acidithiobacillus sp. CV18-2]MBU2797842.1 FtsQ-type POTRA domain-containing protein [Acidithiobacillus sp. VAN18-2]MBU2799312.1 FtsQ-type POTRA domain-containing protein [Acidithiobacillus sp. VAN18-4]
MVSAIRDLQGYRREPVAKAPPPQESQKPAAAIAPSRPFPWGKTLRASLGGGLLLALGFGALQAWDWVRQPALMPIATIHIEGLSSKIPVYRINRAIAPFLGQGFLWVNLTQVRDALQQVPWVANADVRRVWPDRIAIDLQGVQPVARWLGGAGEVLGKDGKVYPVPANEIPQQLPALFGPADAGLQMLQERQKLDQTLAPLHLQVRALELDPRGGWRCILSNGVRLVLGREKIMEGVQRWVSVAPEIKQYLVPGASMDLRYNNGFAVALPEAASTSVSEGSAAPRSERK